MSAPRKRGDCRLVTRPCPYIRCKYHMLWVYLEKNCRYNHKYRHMRGDILEKYTDDEILELIRTMPESCVLDVADQGYHTLIEVAKILDLSHQRIQALSHGIGPVKGYLEKMKEGLDDHPEPYRNIAKSVCL